VRVLVVNAGSSSLKLSALDDDALIATNTVAAAGSGIDTAAVEEFVSATGGADAVGHRIVHGGTEFTEPARIDARVRARLAALTDLAPLHQPKSLAALDAVTGVLPEVPAVACFDTAFHATIPPAAATYALPPEWRRRWPLRRFGFHGLSHAYASRRAAALVGRPVEALRTVTCHLGAGASVAAVRAGLSVDTTMGFTPLEGLVMATRSGSVDPGLVLWLEEHAGMPPAELAATLEHRSGLLGLTGTADLKAVLDAEGNGDPDAALAVGVYLHRLRGAVATMAAAMDGLDVLVFTGGAGERSAPVRERAAAGLGFLGVAIDVGANRDAVPDCEVTGAQARVRTYVVEAREDLQIAGEVRRLLQGPPTASC
jgi:acetate kinase